MPKYTITRPDGSEYEVDANSMTHANELVETELRQQAIEKGRQDFAGMPMWAKPFQAADDLARSAADTLTFGFLDKALGGDNPTRTAVAKDRAGLAGTALDVGTAVGAFPTAVPRVAGWLARGPVGRTLWGAGTAALEGGAAGGLSAVGHDQPVMEGVGIGAGGGVLGQAGASVAGKIGAKIMNDLPPVTTRQANQLARAVRSNPPAPSTLTPEEAKALQVLVSGGGTTARAGNYITNKLTPSFLTGGVGAALLGHPAEAAAATIIPAAGVALKASSNAAMRDAADIFRRNYLRKPKPGILSQRDAAEYGIGLRQALLDEYGQ